jgi:hypothetical protein
MVAKHSHVRVHADGISCPLRSPTTCGCFPDAMSVWFGKVLPWLVSMPSFVGVAALMAPQCGVGPRTLGPMPPGLITPCGVVLSSYHPYPVACKLVRWLALPWWRRFESPGGIMLSMHVEGENHLSPNMKGFGVWCSGTFWTEDTRLHPIGLWPAWRDSSRSWQPGPSLST